MRDSEAFFQSRLEQIRAEGRYRTFTDFKRRVGAYTLARKCDAGNLGSTKAGARGLAHHTDVSAASSSRNGHRVPADRSLRADCLRSF